MKRINIISITTCVIIILFALAYHLTIGRDDNIERKIKVGMILDGDESAPYNNNFLRVISVIEAEYGDRVEVIALRNMPESDVDEAMETLLQESCDLIITTSYGYGEKAKKYAEKYKGIEFIEATCDNANTEPKLKNYHTFMGRVHEARYLSGVVAGLKLQEMIDKGIINSDEALVGYVGAYPVNEVISGYTAFFLGVRSVAPTAKMKVCYTDSWSDYALEKEYTERLIADGCVIISQHSDTIGPAIACEEASERHPVYHVGYNQSMIDIAPTAALVSCRINWIPYIMGAVEAVLADEDIEEHVEAECWENDMCGGFDRGWVEMIELNKLSAAEGTEEKMNELIEEFKENKVHVFQGDYIGVNPDDPSDTWDLKKEYMESKTQSAPTFHYILKDVIEIVDYSE